jgi:hypothetical protein
MAPMMACWRVPVRYYRRDTKGRSVIVARDGPIIDAPDAADAKQRAETICLAFPDFASVGEPRHLHERSDHRAHVAASLTRELRPAPKPASLDEALLAMVAVIRRKRVS